MMEMVTAAAAPVLSVAVLAPIVSRVRSDVHARRGAGGARCVREPLTDERVENHLAGGVPVGAYPMRPGETTTRIAVLDLDAHKGETDWPAMCDAALSLIEALEAAGMAPQAFRSTGGKGIHIYLVWDVPQDAYSVRSFLRGVLGGLGFADGTGGVIARQIEIFPKQDAIAADGKSVGSMFVLPLAGRSEPLDWIAGGLELMGRRYAALIAWHASPSVPAVERPPRAVRQVEAGDVTTDMLRSALNAIPSDEISAMSYDEWFRMVCGIHHGTDGADEGLALAMEFSARSAKHDGGYWLESRTWPYLDSRREGAVAVDHVFRAAYRFGFTDHLLADFDIETGKGGAGEQLSTEAQNALKLAPTEDSVARAFAELEKGRVLYAHLHGRWMVWDGSRWANDVTLHAFNRIRNIARGMNERHGNKPSVAKAAFSAGAEKFARADPTIAVRGDEFDLDNYLLNTPKGTIDLRTGVMRPANKADRITKSTAVSPTSKGGAVFLRFMDQITGGDQEQVRFLQVSMGACLSGARESHWMVFWHGDGRNGKNTLGEIVMYIMGDYARKIPTSTLLAKNFDAHPTEIANLQGIRLAVSSEVADGDRWNETRINELTGDGTLSARYMRGDFFTFPRTHKHLIFGNHKPQLHSSTDALRSRIKIVPFTQCFKGREDPTLPAKLTEEAGFILHWLIEGHKMWLAAGRKLPPCAAVDQASQAYFESQSTVDTWIADRLTEVPDDGRGGRGWPKAGDLYADYQAWKKDRGEVPVSQTRWAESMARRFAKIRADGWRYKGVSLNPLDFDD